MRYLKFTFILSMFVLLFSNQSKSMDNRCYEFIEGLKNLEYDKFSSEFEFTETSDQLKSIKEIEEDLSQAKPMDRLICGDVGFGKTEIAMRAAFLILSSGFQVAIVCPKVLLVEQHFKTFCKR